MKALSPGTTPVEPGQVTPASSSVSEGDAERDPTAGEISVHDLRKVFERTGGSKVAAVDGVSLDVAAGEIVVLLGPSGCGKTTLLRCIAGLETPTSGTVSISGRTVYSASPRVRMPPEQRQISMMFQSYAIWPHMTVRENVNYPLQSRKVPKAERGRMIAETLDKVGIADLVDQYPNQLSGGQQQRVALARCLVVRPSVVLFDEPLSNVDAKVREQLRLELLEMQRTLQFSALYVTHDQEEAMQIADRIAVMKAGRVVQLGPCREVYGSPTSRYVANFVGSVNEWPGTRVPPATTVTTDFGAIEVRADRVSADIGNRPDVVVYVRPEDVRLNAPDDGRPTAANEWTGTVLTSMFLGSHTEYVVEIPGARLRVWDADRDAWPEGAVVRVRLPEGSVGMLPAADIELEESET